MACSEGMVQAMELLRREELDLTFPGEIEAQGRGELQPHVLVWLCLSSSKDSPTWVDVKLKIEDYLLNHPKTTFHCHLATCASRHAPIGLHPPRSRRHWPIPCRASSRIRFLRQVWRRYVCSSCKDELPSQLCNFMKFLVASFESVSHGGFVTWWIIHHVCFT